jgi:catechol 2,3-dioxygenase
MTATRTAALPDATTLGPVRLQVAELERSLGYYRDVLGFRVGEAAGRRATLAAGGDEAPLVILEAHPGAAPLARRGRLGLYHFAILLPDRADLGRIVSHLGRGGVRIGASDHLVSEALYLTDPDGLGIEVYADRPRGEWQWREGDLIMATNPLDLDSLVAAAGAREWGGMPAGTRVGHVHLHVGSLAEGEAFYGGALGLAPTARSYPGALFLSAGGYHHHLGINTWAGPTAVAPGPDDARLLEWSVVVPSAADATAVVGRVGAAGYPAREVEGGWILTDPWGTELRLTAATGNSRA